jgi:hypothetical protein
MYYIKDRTTGHNLHYVNRGIVQKAYSFRVLAEKDLEASESEKAQRKDVVEISKSARLYLENQKRLKG